MPNVLENEPLKYNIIKLLQPNCVRSSPYIAADPILLYATAITLVIIGPSIGASLINISLIVGEFAKTGWLVYPPPSELKFSPDVGVDYYLWAIQISGIGTLLTGVNFVTLMLKMQAPGMRLTCMPIFCLTSLASNLLIVAALPILTATLALLILDRYLGFHFFTSDGGGNAKIFINQVWAWGHPEVYILVLSAFGVFSDVIATFYGKLLDASRS